MLVGLVGFGLSLGAEVAAISTNTFALPPHPAKQLRCSVVRSLQCDGWQAVVVQQRRC